MNVAAVYVLNQRLPQGVVAYIQSFQRNPILVIQRAIRNYHFRFPILTEMLYKAVVQSIPRMTNNPFALIRHSSMGSEEWCCPFKQGYFWGFGKCRYSRDKLYHELYRLKQHAYALH